MNGTVYIQEGIASIIKNDVPNWTTLIVEIIIALLIFWIGWRDNKRYQKNLDYQSKTDQEMNQRFESQIEYTKKLVESIKSTLDEKEKAVFEESMVSFIFKKFHEYLTEFVNLWGQYKQNEMMRIGHRIEDEIDIISQNMQDLVAKSELEISSEKLKPLKDLANDYDEFAHRIGYMGDHEEFNREGEELSQKTIKLKEIITKELQNYR